MENITMNKVIYEVGGKVERGGKELIVLTKAGVKMWGADDIKVIPYEEFETLHVTV